MRNKVAIIIGGSITGCLIAEAISEVFEKVLILEKEQFENFKKDRKNVPQEKHVHVLLNKGEQLIEEIFPKLMDDLKRGGANYIDMGIDIDWFQFGSWKKKISKMGLYTHFFSRKLLDNCVKKRILNNSKIEIISNSSFDSYLYEKRNNSICVAGVKIYLNDNEKVLYSDLVIDASGYGSKTDKLLKLKGLGTTVKEEIITNLGYVSRLYKRDKNTPNKNETTVVWSKPPKEKAIGLIIPVENDQWLVSVGGWHNNFPDKKVSDFLKFTKDSIPVKQFYDRIKNYQPISDVYRFKLKGGIWKHYEKLEKFPDGLLVTGSALCAPNPFYGQGITLSAIQANIIKSNIEEWTLEKQNTAHIQSLFTRSINTSWNMAKIEDLRFSETVGNRNIIIKLIQWYGKKFSKVSSLTYFARKIQLEIIHLNKSFYWMFHPIILFQMIVNHKKI
ncbi:hypothetical protein HN014_01185 [Aquimarina sp. TRL1]|uniref:hypothetical protein n=1 Tax=Aquimarina sp. (strain TRL1) TaxID=2736252 RepID=UPI00158BA8BF|nr:hypothetical protein [Aquimarina sp. TRL1]QKX03581.1 hypothetical protein HN014_01185 [Aquimarina sp. TRL1]